MRTALGTFLRRLGTHCCQVRVPDDLWGGATPSATVPQDATEEGPICPPTRVALARGQQGPPRRQGRLSRPFSGAVQGWPGTASRPGSVPLCRTVSPLHKAVFHLCEHLIVLKSRQQEGRCHRERDHCPVKPAGHGRVVPPILLGENGP